MLPPESPHPDSLNSDVHESKVAVLRDGIDRDMRRRRIFHKVRHSAAFIVLLLIGLYYALRWADMLPESSFSPFFLIHLVNLGAFIASKYLLDRSLADSAARMNDIRLVGPLIDILDPKNHGYTSYDRNTQDVVKNALVRLLPQLTEDNRHLANEQQCSNLRRLLPSEQVSSDLKVAIMRALSKIDDGTAARLVEKLANQRARRGEEEVACVATEVLPTLKEREAMRKNKETLLRASQLAPIETLVRPVGGLPAMPSESLLRPTESC